MTSQNQAQRKGTVIHSVQNFKSSKSKDVPVEFQDLSGFTSNAKKSEISFVVAARSCLSSITMKAGLSGI